MSAKNEHGLTPQQERFAQLIAAGAISASAAYRECYPRAKKWKDSAVHVAASELLAHAKVRGRVDEIQGQAAEKAGLDATKVLEEVRRVAHSDIAGIMTADGKVKLPHELDPVTRAAVASFKIDEYGRIEYKFWDKNTALEKAMKHLGLYEADNNQQPPVVTKIELVGVRPKQKKEGGDRG